MVFLLYLSLYFYINTIYNINNIKIIVFLYLAQPFIKIYVFIYLFEYMPVERGPQIPRSWCYMQVELPEMGAKNLTQAPQKAASSRNHCTSL